MPLIYHIAWWVAYGFAALYFIMVIYCFIGICRLKRQPLQEDGNCPDMTVIFAAKDEADNISATMDSLLAQNYPADKMHVIAVNDRSSDATGDILDGYKEKFVRLDVIHLNECPAGVSPKKNAIRKALELADTDYVIATDADALHRPGWIRSYVSLNQKNLGLATGISMFSKTEFHSSWERRWQAMQTLENLSHNMVMAGAMGNGWGLTANGSNVYYRKDLFDGGDAMRSDVVSGDDTFTVYEAQKRGMKTAFNIHPESVVKLLPENSIADVVNQRVRWGSKVIRSELSVVIFGIYLMLFYLSIILFPLWIFADPGALLLWSGLSGIKLFCDFLYMIVSLKRFKIRFRVTDLLLMELVHAPFIVYCGLAGVFGKFTWKDTNYKNRLSTEK